MVARPGRGFASAASSRDVSRYAARPSSVAFSGRFIPAGGIIPARTFRMTFSQVSADFGTSLRSACSRVKPPVRALSLWQVTQYVLMTVVCAAAFASAGLRTAAAGCKAIAANATPATTTIALSDNSDLQRLELNEV